MPLDPIARKLLDEVAASAVPTPTLPARLKGTLNFESRFTSLGEVEAVAAVADHVIPVSGAAVPARSYVPAGAGARAPLVQSTSTAVAGCWGRSTRTTAGPGRSPMPRAPSS